jgi:isopenicillin N synthase-like dioxygenase
MSYAGVAEQTLAAGHARRRLEPADRDVLNRLREAAREFFGLPGDRKAEYGDGASGYGGYGLRWSEPEDPGQRDDRTARDECETFSLYGDRPERVPNYRQIPGLTAALLTWQRVAARITAEILGDLANSYGYRGAWRFEPTSCLQVSNYGRPDGRGSLILPHTDSHVITLVCPDQPGLEIEVDGVMQDIWAAPDEMFVLAGELLELMTGGEVRACRHQVSQRDLPEGRTAVLYFVNTPFAGEVPPYLLTNANRGVDVAAAAVAYCTRFGQEIPADLIPARC